MLFGLFKKPAQTISRAITGQGIRTRFAPSPTGYMHIGSLRTALYSYLFARQQGGKFILRIEDTDRTRLVPDAMEKLIKSMIWAGLTPDEGVIIDEQGNIGQQGNHGPYIQSERFDLYRRYADQLIASDHAYKCFCSAERLATLREEQQKNGEPTHYDWHCRYLLPAEIEQKVGAGLPFVIRLKVPEKEEIKFIDSVRGEVSFKSDDVDDQVLIKADGFATYHLANVVDDHEMAITHVIRGDEWISSTPKHILLYRAFSWTAPHYTHLPLILSADKKKLSKRQGDVAVDDYVTKGYLPEALVNFVALLGWNPGTDQEIFTIEELIKLFSLERIHKSGAVFDIAKLDWMNSEYIKKLTPNDFVRRATPFLEAKFQGAGNNSTALAALALEQARVKTLAEVGDGITFALTNELNYDVQALIWKKSTKEETLDRLQRLVGYLTDYNHDWSAPELEKYTIDWIAGQGLTNGEVLWPMRYALTGIDRSPTPFEVASVLGKEKTLARLGKGIEGLK